MRLSVKKRLCLAVGALGICLTAAAQMPSAQPAPSFRTGCASVGAELDKLGPAGDELVTIDVVGRLTLVEFDGAIAYMGVCGSPAPKVMCIGYSIEGWKVGDPVILTGGVNRGNSDTIVLDPCLPSQPKQDDMSLLEPPG